MENDEISKLLLSGKSPERRKAAKEIRKNVIVELGDILYASYCKEQNDSRTWETKVEMILALGFIDYKPAIPNFEKIVQVNHSHDMITYAAAQSYVRLKRTSINDGAAVIELLRFGGLSLVDGALTPLGYDKMIPSVEEIREIISLCWDLQKHKDRVGFEFGYSDPRYGLVAACAGWDRELTAPFLHHCLATIVRDNALRIIAENSLKGKYSKLR